MIPETTVAALMITTEIRLSQRKAAMGEAAGIIMGSMMIIITLNPHSRYKDLL